MNKKFNIGILIGCFLLSGINAGWAAPSVIETPPVVVPALDDIQSLNQQVLALDRRNRDEEIAIKQLITENDLLARQAMARQKDERLARIDHVMTGYENALYNRDHERIMAQSHAEPSMYAELISLTQATDKLTVHRELEDKSSLLTEKYAMLRTLKEEMASLNEKLSLRSAANQGEQENIQMLIDKLKRMDGKIKRLDDILARKEEQIARLNKIIEDQKSQIATLKAGRKSLSVISTGGITAVTPITVNAPDKAKDALIQEKQQQIDLLKSELEKRISQNKGPGGSLKPQFEERMAQRGEQMDLLKSELQRQVSQNQWLAQVARVANTKAEYYRLTAQISKAPKAIQPDERIKLSQQLINLQQQQAALLEEKSDLEDQQMNAFDRRFSSFDAKIKALLASRQIKDMDMAARVQALQNALSQRQQQAADLKSQLESKIAEAKNQMLLAGQIRDLTARLQDKENQVNELRSQVRQGQAAGMEADSLKQQLADDQYKADQLKQQLDAKTTEAVKMAALAGDYQRKLEDRNNAYNKELQQVLSLNQVNGHAQQEIDDLNQRLQQKEAEVVRIKKQMYDLKGSLNAKDMDIQAKDLSLSMVQQKMMNEKIRDYQDKINQLKAVNVHQLKEISTLRSELDQARQEVQGAAAPGSDELDFLRAGLKKTTDELNQKGQLLAEVKAHADEYEKEFQQQSAQMESLKAQLRQARVEILRKNDDLKYDGLAIARLKYFLGKPGKGSPQQLQEGLKRANLKIKELQDKLNQLQSPYLSDAASRKLRQALDKIDEQGHIINLLTQKLQAYGQSMDLSKNIKE